MPHGPTDNVIWAGGFDLAGPGMLSTFEQEVTSVTEEVQLLGPRGVIEHYVPVGVGSVAISEEGYLDSAGVDLRRTLQDDPLVLINGLAGPAVGAPCLMATQMSVRKHTVTAQNKGLSRISVEWQQGDGGVIAEEAILLAGGQRVTAAQSSVAWFDNTAENTDGLLIALMADGIVWDSATELEISIRTSASDSGSGSAYGGSGAVLSITPGTDTVRGALYAVSANDASRYLGMQWTWTGGGASRSAKILAAVVNR